VKREKALAVFEIGDRVQIRQITPIGLMPIYVEGNIVQIKLTNDSPRKLVLELNTGLSIELSSWAIHEQEIRK
jgi:hypothetical protein